MRAEVYSSALQRHAVVFDLFAGESLFVVDKVKADAKLIAFCPQSMYLVLGELEICGTGQRAGQVVLKLSDTSSRFLQVLGVGESSRVYLSCVFGLLYFESSSQLLGRLFLIKELLVSLSGLGGSRAVCVLSTKIVQRVLDVEMILQRFLEALLHLIRPLLNGD